MIFNRSAMAGPLPEIYIGDKPVSFTSEACYVGMNFDSSGPLFRRHAELKAESATQVMRAIFSSRSYVNDLTHGADVAIDVHEADAAPLESAQLSYLRQALHVNPRSMRAFLFSETGLMPVRYRRLMLALRALKYYIESPPESYPRQAASQAIALAGAGCVSWASWLSSALQRAGVQMPRSGVTAFFSTTEIDELIRDVSSVPLASVKPSKERRSAERLLPTYLRQTSSPESRTPATE